MDLTGKLLVATPSLRDPTFHRTVVLLLDHGADGGLGVVLNRPLEVDVEAVLPPWQPWTTEPGVLFQGGPVALDSALALAGVPGDGPEPAGVRRLKGSIGLVDLDSEPEDVVSGLSGLRVFAGYAGWGGGQLEREVAEGSWYVVESEARDAFVGHPERLWREVLRRQPGDLALVATFPEDPDLNCGPSLRR
jgi:putative transcriptional regulator